MNDNGAPSTDGAQTEAPAAPKTPSASVQQLLGLLHIEDLEPGGRPAPNSTRWVFEVRTKGAVELVICLLNFRTGRPMDPDIMSYSFTPTNRATYRARPVLWDEDGLLHIETEANEDEASFRVFVDVMHSATR